LTDSAGGPHKRGRPVDRGRDQVILDTVQQLMVEKGSVDFSMAELAARAGVSTATVYRRWHTKEALILDVFTEAFDDAPQPDRGDAYTEVLEMLQRRRVLMSSAIYTIAMPVVFQETLCRTELGQQFVERTVGPFRRDTAGIYRRAVERGQFADVIAPEIFVDLLVGPLLRQLLETSGPLTESFVEQVARTVVDGLSAPKQVG
jgi:AcrR family transcriptional regulator